MEINIKTKGYKCLRCGHIWAPKTSRMPKQCPRCRNTRWNKPRGFWRIERRKLLETQSIALAKIIEKI